MVLFICRLFSIAGEKERDKQYRTEPGKKRDLKGKVRKMKKEDLVAMGLTAEQVDKVVQFYEEAVKGFVPKARLDEVIGERDSAKKDLAVRDKQLEDIEKDAGDNTELQGTIKQLQAENKKAKEEYEKEIKETRLTSAIKVAIAGKVHDVEIVANQFDKGKISVDENGKLTGLDDQLKALQENKAFLFKTGQQQQNYNPQNGSVHISNPFAKETFNLTEQGKLLKENPVGAKEMASAAGITI